MIKLDISNALFFYLLFTVAGILVLWAFFDFRTKFRDYSEEEKSVWQCSACLYSYIDSRHGNISKCPRCGSYNVRETD